MKTHIFCSALDLSKVSIVQMIEVSDKHAEIDWLPLLPIQCCAFVLNYTVFYRSYNETTNRSKSDMHMNMNTLHRLGDIDIDLLFVQMSLWDQISTVSF